MPCGTSGSHAGQQFARSRGKYREVTAELVSGDQISTPNQFSQRLVGGGDQILRLAGVLNVSRCVPERTLVQAGRRATPWKSEPDSRVAERYIAAPDPVVLRPLDIYGGYQPCPGRTCGHCC